LNIITLAILQSAVNKLNREVAPAEAAETTAEVTA
jgi:hypothetical protein